MLIFDGLFSVPTVPKKHLSDDLTANVLTSCIGSLRETSKVWVGPISDVARDIDLSTVYRLAAFLAHIGHETNRLTEIVENMNYSSTRLSQVFGRYFTAAELKQYANKPESIGNRVYANRMGNGPEESGDGYAFRGRGLIHLTGRANYRCCGKALGLDLEGHPELAATPAVAAMTAGWFWKIHNLNELADLGDIAGIASRLLERYNPERRSTGMFWGGVKHELVGDESIKLETLVINGGLNGLSDRLALYERTLAVLKSISEV